MLAMRVDDDLELVLLEERHTQELFELTDINRAHLRRWLPWLDTVTASEHSAQFIKRNLELLSEKEGYDLGIRYRGALAGVIGYNTIDWSNRQATLGYWIGDGFQGRGLVTRACARLIDHAITELKLHRVEIRCAVENTRSRAVPERLAFQQEGVIRDGEWLYDHFVDLAVYGLLEQEWCRPVSPPARQART